MSIDYLPDEMNYDRSNLCWNESDTADAFNAGWRAACEAKQAQIDGLEDRLRATVELALLATDPQPASDWRLACVVRQHENGWGIYSPSGHFWLGLWHTKGMLCKVWKWRGPHKELPLYNSREVAERDLLTMQCSPPPDWEVDWEAARDT